MKLPWVAPRNGGYSAPENTVQGTPPGFVDIHSYAAELEDALAEEQIRAEQLEAQLSEHEHNCNNWRGEFTRLLEEVEDLLEECVKKATPGQDAVTDWGWGFLNAHSRMADSLRDILKDAKTAWWNHDDFR